jgi:predicted O-linked N-acetylglucosamine transferase (SPINDLY family)
MVTMYGKTMVSRMGLSILSSINLSDYCVDDKDKYVQRVKEISKLSKEESIALKNTIKLSSGKKVLSKEIEDIIKI